MASSTRTIDVLLKEIGDPALRARLVEAVNALRKQTRFGLVFEGHHPEVSRLPEVAIRKGALVARRSEKGNVLYRVESVARGKAVCLPEDLPPDAERDLFAHAVTVPVVDLVVARRFGDAIYPSLKLVDAVERAPEKPWHILLQADNYHALQALTYTHAGKVDVIYLDPPYNTGAKNWRYNNDYVDLNDPWRHSKWLSFMEKRLRLAKKLIKPDGVLIVTIDEHEVHHLGCLLEQEFPEAYRQMVTIIINPKGVTQGRFSRVEEHALFCFMGTSMVKGIGDDLLTTGQEMARTRSVRWKGLLRSGTNARRVDRKKMFFPVVVDPARRAVVGVGEPLAYPETPDLKHRIGGFPVAWPIRSDHSEGNWGVGAVTLAKLVEKGYVRLGEWDSKRKTWGISYLSKKPQSQIKSGALVITAYDKERNVVEVEYADEKERQIKTVWHRTAHDAGAFGSDLLRSILGGTGKFTFPKSLYAVLDVLLSLLRDKPNGVVLDFFAGSGTTFHAVSLMNAVDGGQRQCILVTNNEVSEEDRKSLQRAGNQEGDPDWEEHGICRAVTWPRCKYVVQGKRDDGTGLQGEYATGKFEEQEVRRTVTHLSFAEGSPFKVGDKLLKC